SGVNRNEFLSNNFHLNKEKRVSNIINAIKRLHFTSVFINQDYFIYVFYVNSWTFYFNRSHLKLQSLNDNLPYPLTQLILFKHFYCFLLVENSSLFGAKNLVAIRVLESLVQIKESLKNIIDQTILNIISNLRINAVSASTLQGLFVPISGTLSTSPVESTTLVPVLEEFEEHVQQQNEF
ncbi:hypothetical protein EWB00_010853, partial [Schistosoma japonicum]